MCCQQDPRAAQRAKRRRLLTDALSARIRRGLIRYLEVIVDLSRASATTDFRPTRFSVVLGVSCGAAGDLKLVVCALGTHQHLHLAADCVQQCACCPTFIHAPNFRFLVLCAGVLQQFIREFFDQNPLSHLGILVLRNGVAERLTDLSGSPVRHQSRI